MAAREGVELNRTEVKMNLVVLGLQPLACYSLLDESVWFNRNLVRTELRLSRNLF